MAILAGCSFFSEKSRIRVFLPGVPENYKSLLSEPGFILLIPDKESTWSRLYIPSGTREVVIPVQKRQNLPLLAYPVFPEFFENHISDGADTGGSLPVWKPAGALFPLHLQDNNTIEIKWEHGFIASLFKSLMTQGVEVEFINTKRLVEEIWGRSGGNPWVLNDETILEALSYRNFRADLIREKDNHFLSVTAQKGIWISCNPFDRPLTSNPEGKLNFNRIHSGFNRFFHAESRSYLDIYIDELEWILIDSEGERIESGNW